MAVSLMKNRRRARPNVGGSHMYLGHVLPSCLGAVEICSGWWLVSVVHLRLSHTAA